MSFIEQTAKIFGELADFKFSATLFGRDAFCIEGARPVSIDGERMVFRAAGALITVSGTGLAVKELSDDFAAVVGSISAVAVEGQ